MCSHDPYSWTKFYSVAFPQTHAHPENLRPDPRTMRPGPVEMSTFIHYGVHLNLHWKIHSPLFIIFLNSQQEELIYVIMDTNKGCALAAWIFCTLCLYTTCASMFRGNTQCCSHTDTSGTLGGATICATGGQRCWWIDVVGSSSPASSGHTAQIHENQKFQGTIYLSEGKGGGVKELCTSVTELDGPRGHRPNTNKLQQLGPGNSDTQSEVVMFMHTNQNLDMVCFCFKGYIDR